LLELKKSVGGKIATSSVGKKIIKEIIGQDGVKILAILKQILTDLYGKEKAKETENDIIRISVKIILLYRNETITQEDIKKLKPRLQRLWHICQDYANLLNFDYNAKAVQEHANNFFNVLSSILNGQISEKNMQKMNQIRDLMFATETLDYLYSNETSKEQRKKFAGILEKYYNFN